MAVIVRFRPSYISCIFRTFFNLLFIYFLFVWLAYSFLSAVLLFYGSQFNGLCLSDNDDDINYIASHKRNGYNDVRVSHHHLSRWNTRRRSHRPLTTRSHSLWPNAARTRRLTVTGRIQHDSLLAL